MSEKKLLLLFLFVTCTKCFAQNVNTKNGDFYVSYTDTEFKDHPLSFEITRSYHSRAVEKGWFGMGWGSNYESRLYTIPGGGIIVYSWGKIGFEMFKPMQWDLQQITKAVNKMATIAQQKLDVQTPEEIAGFKNKLMNNEDERIKYWLKYLEKGLVEEIKITAGSRLGAVTGGSYYIQVLDKGYKIPFNEGQTRFFDSTGRLQKLVNKKGDEITLDYDEDGYPSVMRDNLNNMLRFTFDDEGLVHKIIQKQANGKTDTSFYTYDPNTQTLLSNKDIEANYYEYEWDHDFYLTRIVYTDGTDTKITYDVNGLATSVKRKNGSKTVYTYPTPSSKEYGTTTTDFDSLGNKTKTNSEWFVLKTDDLGKDWEYKRVIVNNDDSITIVSNERFQLADTVYLNKGKYYSYQYDNKRNLTAIHANGELLAEIIAKDDKLKEIVAAGKRYRAVYKDGKVEKLVTEKNEEIAIPLSTGTSDPSGIRTKVQEFLPAFKYTVLWYDLQFTD